MTKISNATATATANATISNIRAWAAELQQYGLIDAGPYDNLMQALTEAEQGGLGRAQSPLLTVLLFGPSGVGKSQLLNALAGEVIAQSHYERPTTRIPTVYAHADVDLDRLFEYGTELGEMGQQTHNVVRHTREALRNVVVIDAPDIDSYQRQHRERVMALLPMMDVVLYVVTAQTYLNDLGWQTVLKERGRRAFAFVINKWDREGKRTPGATAGIDIDAHFRQLLRERAGYDNAVIFRTSAEYWLQQRVSGQRSANSAEQAQPDDQFQALERWLSSALSTSHVAEIQRRRRRALWGSVAEALSQAMPNHLRDQPWQAQTLAQLDALQSNGWEHIQPLIAMNSADWAQQAHIGRWPSSPGPFGLILKMGDGLRDAVTKFSRRGLPVQMGPLRANLPILPAEAVAAPSSTALITTDNTGLALLADGTVADVSLALRSANVPSQWLTQRMRTSVGTFPPRLGGAIRSALAEAEAKPYSPARRGIGISVLVLIEIAMTGVLGIAAWRLIEGFWLKQYVDGSFVTHLLLLIALVTFVGVMALNALFPQPARIVAAKLEARLRQVWTSFMGELKGNANEFAQTTERLLIDGGTIKESINAELRELAPRVEMGNDDDDDGDTVEQLFGKTAPLM